MDTGKPATRAAAALAVTGVLCAVLAACTSSEEQMTPETVRVTLVTTVTDTAALIEGPDWAETLTTGAQECAVGAVPGTMYGYAYSAPRPDRDRLADVEKVAEYWESLGMDIHIVPERPAVYGAGGPIQSIEFSTDPGNYLIGGTSLCAPGESAEDAE
jgi:hypothetical protein